MNDRTLQIYCLDPSNKTFSTKISYVNPAATDENLLSFAKAYVQLTENTYSATFKNDETALD